MMNSRVTHRDDYALTHPLRGLGDSFDVGRHPDEFVHAVGGLVVESSILTEAVHAPTVTLYNPDPVQQRCDAIELVGLPERMVHALAIKGYSRTMPRATPLL
jgi:hypothetical protein